MEGHAGDRDAPGIADEVEKVPAASVWVLVEEVGDGAGETWQEFAVGTSPQAVMGGLDHLLGGEALLSGGSGPAESEQTCDLSDRESNPAVEEEVAEESDGVIVVAAALQEGKGGVEHGALGGGQSGLGDGGVCQPTGEVRGFCGHGVPSVAGDGSSLWRRSWKCTQKARKTIWC